MQLDSSKNKYCHGVSVIEIVIGASLALTIVLFATSAIVNFVRTGNEVSQRSEALIQAERMLESARFVRDTSYAILDTLSRDTPYAFSYEGGVSVTTTPTVSDFGTAYVLFSSVNRDASTDDIVSVGGVTDPDTLLVTAYVIGDTSTTTLSTYLTNLFNI